MPESSPLSSPVLICLAGLPAAGKSYFAEKLAVGFFDDHGVKSMVVASDTVRAEIPALKKDFLPELEPVVREMTLERVRMGLEKGLTVIHDDLNYYRSMRFELVTLSRELQVPYMFVHIATSRDQCLAQNADRGRKIPDEVIVKDSARFDAPGEDPWDEPIAVVEAPGFDDDDVRNVIRKIIDAAESYTPWSPPEPTVHVSTVSEELDLLARRVVGDLYRDSKLRVDSKQISATRHALVDKAINNGYDFKAAEDLFRQELGALFQ